MTEPTPWWKQRRWERRIENALIAAYLGFLALAALAVGLVWWAVRAS